MDEEGKYGKYICRATSKYGTDERQFVATNGEDTQSTSKFIKLLWLTNYDFWMTGGNF